MNAQGAHHPMPERRELPSPSPILALHGRHEACCREAEAIERVAEDHRSDPDARTGLAEAGMANRAEQQALRDALLRQSPRCWPEALVLAYHLAGALSGESDGERGALRAASESLLDFLASEVDVDHEPLGDQFQAATVRALRRRQLRFGQVGPDPADPRQ